MPRGKYNHYKIIGRKYPKELYPNHGMRGKRHSEEAKRNISLGVAGKTKDWGYTYSTIFRLNHPEEYKKQQIKAHIKSIATQKKKEIGFFNPEVGRQGGKRSTEVNRKNKTGLFDPKNRNRNTFVTKLGWGYSIHRVLRRKNPEKYYQNLSKGGKKGGVEACKSNRENKPFYFLGVPFDSNIEKQIAKQLFFADFFIPEERINCHVKIDGIEIDFKLFNYLFIEYHPWDIKGKTFQEYYEERRKVLNENGYSKYPLFIIKSLKNMGPIFSQVFQDHSDTQQKLKVR